MERAEELSKGNLSSRVYLETKDELSELGGAFNKIAEDLERSHEVEENTEKSVDIKVKARTQALEETIDALEQKVRNRTAELQSMIKDLEKMQQQLMMKESEVSSLRQQAKPAGENVNGRQKKKTRATETENNVEDKIENA